jgi:hypothetical protein
MLFYKSIHQIHFHIIPNNYKILLKSIFYLELINTFPLIRFLLYFHNILVILLKIFLNI